jgi:hypothetical protein
LEIAGLLMLIAAASGLLGILVLAAVLFARRAVGRYFPLVVGLSSANALVAITVSALSWWLGAPTLSPLVVVPLIAALIPIALVAVRKRLRQTPRGAL